MFFLNADKFAAKIPAKRVFEKLSVRCLPN